MSYVLAAYIATGVLIGAYIASVIWRTRAARRENARVEPHEGREA